MSNLSVLVPGIIEDIFMSRIRSPEHQIRPSLGNLDGLCLSIKQKGLLQPIVIRVRGEYFEIVAGNRRYQACKSLGWRKIPSHVVELNDKEAFEISLIENLQRRNLNAVDEAYAFKAYISDYGWGGASELASRIGRTVSYVTKRVRLLDLPVETLHSIANYTMSPSVAEELISIDNRSRKSELAQLISERRLSMRDARRIIKEFGREPPSELTAYQNGRVDRFDREDRLFDKSITVLRLAMERLATIIGSARNNWITYEILMQHRNALHNQIDILIKQKRKLRY